MSAEERPSLHQLEADVDAELRMVQSDHPDEALAMSPAEWLFDPSDIDRYRTGLQGLLGAVKALEEDPEPRHAIVDVRSGGSWHFS